MNYSQMLIAFLVVAAIAYGIYYLLNSEKASFFDLPTSDKLSNWHSNISQNQIAVTANGIGGEDKSTVWWNNDMPKNAPYGKEHVEFKYGPEYAKVDLESHRDEVAGHGHPAQTDDEYGNKAVYGEWEDPMGVFPLNTGAYKTKRLVRNKDWASVLVGVPGATPEQLEKRLDKMFYPNKNKITAAERQKMFRSADLNDPIGNASPGEFYNEMYAADRIKEHMA